MIKAVVTVKFIDHFGSLCTCNIIENMDSSFNSLKHRIDALEARGYRRTGDTTIQFVEL